MTIGVGKSYYGEFVSQCYPYHATNTERSCVSTNKYHGVADATRGDRYEHLAEIRQGRSDRDS
jgi:hypothetical protein